MHIFGFQSFCKHLQLSDFFFRHGKLLSVELVMCTNSSGILVHNFLHGFLKLFYRKQRMFSLKDGIIFRRFVLQCRNCDEFTLLCLIFCPAFDIQLLYHT